MPAMLYELFAHDALKKVIACLPDPCSLDDLIATFVQLHDQELAVNADTNVDAASIHAELSRWQQRLAGPATVPNRPAVASAIRS